MMPERVVVDATADGHIHLREGAVMGPLIRHAVLGGADMLGAQPNTEKGLSVAAQVLDYKHMAETVEIGGLPLLAPMLIQARPTILPFLMITEETTTEVIDECVELGIFHAKIYPRDRTTKSEKGVVRYSRLVPQIRHCGKVGMWPHWHPEHPNMTFINRDAEFAFLPIIQMFMEETEAKIVWEHGTDSRCIPFWEQWAKTGRFFVTLTGHHLATNEDDTFGDVRATCKPPIKTEQDRRALVDLVGKDYPWVMAGSDAAFHPKGAKHVMVGKCACGDFTYPFVLPLYAHALDSLFQTPEGIEVFQNFTSRNARRNFDLPPASRLVSLSRSPWKIPLEYQVGPEVAMPFWAGQVLNWKTIE